MHPPPVPSVKLKLPPFLQSEWEAKKGFIEATLKNGCRFSARVFVSFPLSQLSRTFFEF